VEGSSFGPYRLLTSLGRGGMGEVWQAHDTATDRVVALKVVHAHLSHDKAYLHRFRREAHAATRLNHRHVIPIHTYGEIDGQLFLDMRLVEGRDLDSLIQEGPLDPPRAVGIIEQVASALHAAHTAGMVHRDVKPSNVLLESDDFAYLIDFGIARVVADTDLTGSSNVIGTWAYMAPERFTNPQIDARSDVYALACVLYECLTGTRPFPGDSPELQFGGHLGVPPPSPSLGRPWVPAGFDNVIGNGMAKDPDKRYQTALELAFAAREAATAPAVPIARRQSPTASRFTGQSQRPTAARQDDPHSNPTKQRPISFEARPPLPAAPRPRWRRKRVLVSVASMTFVVVAATITTMVLRDRSTEPGYPLSSAGTIGTDMTAVAVAEPDPSLGTIDAVARTRPSVLKMRAVAPECQKVSEGSAFVVAPDRVMSSARNIAGSATTTVEAEGSTYDSTVVFYDPETDIAILEVPGLPSPPLGFDSREVPSGADAVMLGYPDGGDFTATPARIRETINMSGPDIYRTTTVTREVYTFRSTVRQGNSGGPLIDADGRVLGMLLAADTDDVETGYALTSAEVAQHMSNVGATEEVGTGSCIA
jgi:serine/threonine protein kinase